MRGEGGKGVWGEVSSSTGPARFLEVGESMKEQAKKILGSGADIWVEGGGRGRSRTQKQADQDPPGAQAQSPKFFFSCSIYAFVCGPRMAATEVRRPPSPCGSGF
jgi:hypothetical protein